MAATSSGFQTMQLRPSVRCKPCSRLSISNPRALPPRAQVVGKTDLAHVLYSGRGRPAAR
jgi:hypothetical protein